MKQQTSLRLSAELLAQLDAWCAEQPLKPSRAQAIRSFIEDALRYFIPKSAEGQVNERVG